MNKSTDLVRFDWAIKRLLRNKAYYVVVEGLLTVLLGRPIKIKCSLNRYLEPDRSHLSQYDLLVEDKDGENIVIEIQNDRELNYFHRMAYGTSKAIAEYMKEGEPYEKIRKVYSINIV